MALDDIYNNKRKYERFVEEYINKKKILKKPDKTDYKRRYYCKNKENLNYYKKLIRSFEVDDLSYIRRLRLRDIMNFLTYFIECDLKKANSVEREDIIIKIREITAPSQLTKTASDIRKIGKILFNEDETQKFFKEFKIKTDIQQPKLIFRF